MVCKSYLNKAEKKFRKVKKIFFETVADATSLAPAV